jgi:hypothetical protein
MVGDRVKLILLIQTKIIQQMQFNQILEAIELLSLEEQEDLIQIVKHRQIERRREKIATNIARSRQEYQQDKVFRGTVDDIIAELNK